MPVQSMIERGREREKGGRWRGFCLCTHVLPHCHQSLCLSECVAIIRIVIVTVMTVFVIVVKLVIVVWVDSIALKPRLRAETLMGIPAFGSNYWAWTIPVASVKILCCS